MYEELAQQLSRPNKITFTKIDVEKQQGLARAYGVTALPTFMVFKNGRSIQTIKGADPKKLGEVVKKLATEAQAIGDASMGGLSNAQSNGTAEAWLGAELPKGYRDVTDQVDVKGLELLNFDSDFGTPRALFDSSQPSLSNGKGITYGLLSAGALADGCYLRKRRSSEKMGTE